MITPRITCCKECAEILPLIEEINCRLYKLSLDAYNNLVFSLNTPINYRMALDLLNYKRILTFKMVNESYACEFSVNMIANKIKKYTVGCKMDCDCNEGDLTPTTTTTSSSSSTTTTTTTLVVFSYDLAAAHDTPIAACADNALRYTVYCLGPIAIGSTLFTDFALTIPFDSTYAFMRILDETPLIEVNAPGNIVVDITSC